MKYKYTSTVMSGICCNPPLKYKKKNHTISLIIQSFYLKRTQEAYFLLNILNMTFLNERSIFLKEDSGTRNPGFQKPTDIFVRKLEIL